MAPEYQRPQVKPDEFRAYPGRAILLAILAEALTAKRVSVLNILRRPGERSGKTSLYVYAPVFALSVSKLARQQHWDRYVDADVAWLRYTVAGFSYLTGL